MSRLIKFRGLELNGNKWVYGHLNELEDWVFINVPKVRDIGGNIQEFENYLEDIDVRQTTVGQFTGEKDKNGVDIYEGDILEIGYNYINPQVVIFKNGAFNISQYNIETSEVIGNIYATN